MEPDGLVGRERELAVVETGLARAAAGEGGLVLVVGEAGMGKTALATEAIRRARDRRMSTAWGSGTETVDAWPFRPWVRALGRLGIDLPGVLGAEAGTDPRTRVFEEVCSALRGVTERDPALIVLDDLHWADVPSLRLLEAIAPELPDTQVVLLGLHRPEPLDGGGEAGAVLSRLARVRGGARLSLPPLPAAEATELVRRVIGPAVSWDLVRSTVSRGAGNPLFLVELAHLGPAATAAARPPRAIGDVIAERLLPLSLRTREVLRAAAVLGRDTTHARISEVTGASVDEVTVALDDAARHGLVDAGPAVRFSHPLIREVCAAEVPAEDRRALHQRAASAMRTAQEDVERVDAYAHHLRHAGASHVAEALEATVRAAVAADRALAYETAADLFRAAAALAGGSLGNVRREGRLLVDAARCEFRGGAVASAWATCEQAAAAARMVADAVTLSEAALVIRGMTWFDSPIRDEVNALCRAALAALGDGVDRAPLRARLLGQEAVTSQPWGLQSTGAAAAALAAAEAVNDPDALFLALQARNSELYDVRDIAVRLDVGGRAVALGDSTGVGEYAMAGHQWRADALAVLGRRDDLDTEIAALEVWERRLRDPVLRWRIGLMAIAKAMGEGRLDEALARNDEMREVGRRAELRAADVLHAIFAGDILDLTGGEVDWIEAFVRDLLRAAPPAMSGWHASLLLRVGRPEEARVAWRRAREHALPRTAQEWLLGEVASAGLAVAFDDTDEAEVLRRDLGPFEDLIGTGGASAPPYGPVALALGRLSAFLGDPERAERQLRRARVRARAAGSVVHEALSAAALARLLLASHGGGHAEEARDLLTSALAVARRSGMGPLERDATALLDRVPEPTGRLSSRETQVVALVAEGLTNKQIAARLHLSDRTVETHVRNASHKVGVASRSALAAWHARR